MRIALLTHDTIVHRALAHRLTGILDATLVGLIVEEPPNAPKPLASNLQVMETPGLIARQRADWSLGKVRHRVALDSIEEAALKRFGEAGGVPFWPEVAASTVEDLGGPQSAALAQALRPDILVIAGPQPKTGAVAQLATSMAVLQLRPGLSPLDNALPHAALWALARGEFHHLGATISALGTDAKPAATLLAEPAPLSPNDHLGDVLGKVEETGHHLMVRVVTALSAGYLPQRLAPSPLRGPELRDWSAGLFGKASRAVEGGDLARWLRAGRPGLLKTHFVNAFYREV